MKNSRNNYFKELTGVRVVSMYVQEIFHWGWQKTDQENDDGIDGYIIVRNHAGKDLGAMIKVQIKSGHSYYSSGDCVKSVNISPFNSKESLKSHLLDYSRSTSPVILVWVNTRKKDKNGRDYEDLFHPEVWWQRVDNYKYQNTSIVTLDKKFGEHSKGDLFNLVKAHLNDWIGYQEIQLQGKKQGLFRSQNLRVDALSYYRNWKKQNTYLRCLDKPYLVKKNRTGWRHITYKKRGQERITTSLQLLPLADEIIQEYNRRPVMLNSKLLGDHVICEKYGFRYRVISKGITRKVQVVLIKKINQIDGTINWEFYSLHEIK